MVRILVCGDVRGQLPKLCETVARMHAKLDATQHFKAVFCVGEFSSEEMDLDVKPPVPVYFIDAGPAAEDLINSSPQGEEVGPNLHFLGHYGVTKVAGLAVAYLSGRQQSALFADASAADAQGEADEAEEDRHEARGSLAERYGNQADHEEKPLLVTSLRASSAASSGDPGSRAESWETLKAKEKVAEHMRAQLFVDGCYTPLAVERLQEEIADFGGVDLLLTSEWPKGCMKGLGQAWPEELAHRQLLKVAAKQCSSVAVAELAVAAEPKYHVMGLGGVFWRRAPWRHERRGEVVPATGELRCGVCRLLTLGAIDGSRPGVRAEAIPRGPEFSGPGGADLTSSVKPQKWLHGLDLDPNAMPLAADDSTLSPWSEQAKAASVRAADGSEGAGPLRLDVQTGDREERRRWLQRFGCLPEEFQSAEDKVNKMNQPKEKKEKHKSLYKVSEKEKKRRKTGGDGHLPFHAKERMAAKG
mmetsp:Transcript_36882/g.68913  ORF Transcript_36882/g.68913 Transcript_36882/m.68913 type:complete len:473 (-) Transcript_36882:173-1591(-)